MRIGLVGESPNDTFGLAELLNNKYGQQAFFKSVFPRRRKYDVAAKKLN